MIEFFNIRQHKARKRYMCSVCGDAILPGAEYVYEAAKYDGNVHQMRRHIHCDAMLSAFFDAESTDEYTVLEVLEWACVHACSGCSYNDDGECTSAAESVWVCEIAQTKLLPPHYLEAAKRSVRENAYET